jgi:hypothetical protein
LICCWKPQSEIAAPRHRDDVNAAPDGSIRVTVRQRAAYEAAAGRAKRRFVPTKSGKKCALRNPLAQCVYVFALVLHPVSMFAAAPPGGSPPSLMFPSLTRDPAHDAVWDYSDEEEDRSAKKQKPYDGMASVTGGLEGLALGEKPTPGGGGAVGQPKRL